MSEGRDFVPALGIHGLTRLYDPLIQRWSAAKAIRSATVEAMALQPQMRVLELGAGPGRLALELKRAHPQIELAALDIDPSMVNAARRRARSHGLDIAFHQADMTCLQDCSAVTGSYDRIVSTMVFHHLSPSEKRAALLQAKTLLKPGGELIVVDFGRPRGRRQWALFTFVQQPLDGFVNTTPHRDGRFEETLRNCFGEARSAATWRTIAGTIELFVCAP